MRRLLLGVSCLALAAGARVAAQVPPAAQVAPAQMGITPTTVPEVLQVLDGTKTWVSIGNVNAATHGFRLPVGNLGVGGTPSLTTYLRGDDTWASITGAAFGPGAAAANLGWLDVTDPTIGMAAGGADNSPLLPTLLNAVNGGQWSWTLAGAASAYIHFPPRPNTASTEYYFSDAFDWPRGGQIDCSTGGTYSNTTLVFGPGVDGLIEEVWANLPGGQLTGGFAADLTVKDCAVKSLGFGSANLTDGRNTTDAPVMTTIGAIGPTSWEVGDGIFAMLFISSVFNHENGTNGPNGLRSLTSIPAGTTITAIDGSNNMTMSNPASFADNATNTPGQTMKNAVFRLPKEMAYKVSTEAPSVASAANSWAVSNTTTATAAWQVGATSINVKTCSFPAGQPGFAPGRTVVDSTANVYAPNITLGTVHDCTGTVLTFNAPIPVASIIQSSPAVTVYDTINAVDAITVSTGACVGVFDQTTGAPAQVTDTTFSPSRLIGTLVTCNETTHQLIMLSAIASSGAADALRFTNASFVINDGPHDKLGNAVPMRGGDLLWSDAFPLGNTAWQIVTFEQGQVIDYPYAVRTLGAIYSVTQPAGVTHTAASPGSLWKLPAGIRRLFLTSHHNLLVSFFPIGQQIVTFTSAFGPGGVDTGSTEAYDEDLAMIENGIGEYVAGNNSGGSTNIGGIYGKNFIADLVEFSSIANEYLNVSMNSFENAEGPLSVFGRCDIGMSMYTGGYITAQGVATSPYPTPYCAYADGTLSQPPPWSSPLLLGNSNGVRSGPLMMGQGNPGGIPDRVGIGPGSMYSPLGWKFYGAPVAFATVGGAQPPGGTSVGMSAPLPGWLYDGLQVYDVTTPDAIPLSPKTTIWMHSSPNLILSNPIAGTNGVKSGDVLGFYNGNNTSPCMGIGGGLTNTSALYFDRDCGNQFGWYFHYMGSYGGGAGTGGLWGYSPAASTAAPAAALISGAYQGYKPTNGMLFPVGLELNSNPLAGGSGNERLFDAGPTAGIAAVNASFTAAGPFNTTNTMLPLTGSTCPPVGANALTDTTLNAANPTLLAPSLASCSATQPVLTLQANASQASLGREDALTIGGVTGFFAQDWFTTGNILVPLNTCAGVTVGQPVVDTAISGAPTIGTAGACGPMPTVQLAQASRANSSGASDALATTSRLQGDTRINTAAVAGGFAGWVNTANLNAFRPFGAVAFDLGATTWPASPVATTLAALNTLGCGASNAGANAVITNGIAAPTYLQAMGTTTGTSRRKMFCDGTAWLYD